MPGAWLRGEKGSERDELVSRRARGRVESFGELTSERFEKVQVWEVVR